MTPRRTSSHAVTLPSPEAVRASTLRLLGDEQRGKAISPADIARDIMGADEKVWRLGMKTIGRAVCDMAAAGEVMVVRKGRPVAPGEARGLWKLRRPFPGEEVPAAPTQPIDDDFDD